MFPQRREFWEERWAFWTSYRHVWFDVIVYICLFPGLVVTWRSTLRATLSLNNMSQLLKSNYKTAVFSNSLLYVGFHHLDLKLVCLRFHILLFKKFGVGKFLNILLLIISLCTDALIWSKLAVKTLLQKILFQVNALFLHFLFIKEYWKRYHSWCFQHWIIHNKYLLSSKSAY